MHLVVCTTNKERQKKIQIKLKEKYERNAKAPDVKTIKSWSKKFKESGACNQKSRKRSPTVGREAVVRKFEENLQRSIWRIANCFGISYSAVRNKL